MPKKVNMLGVRVGLLTVIEEVGKNAHGHVLWKLQCDCGNYNVRPNPQIRTMQRNHSRASCGCLRSTISAENSNAGREKIRNSKIKHGQSLGAGQYASEYKTWKTMRQRCFNPRNADFYDYGGRGISVCEEWSDFGKFLHDMGPKPSSIHSLDRIDTNGPYKPENCRWATPTEQANNRRPRGTGHKAQFKREQNHGNLTS